MRLRPGGHLNTHDGLSSSRVKALGRRFVEVTEDDIKKLRRPSPPTQRGPKKNAVCSHCGGSWTAELADVIVDNIWEESPVDANWMTAARLVYEGYDLVIGELRVFPRDKVADDDRVEDPREWSADLLGQYARVPHGGLSARLLRQVRLKHADRRSGLLRLYAERHPRLFEPSGRLHTLGMKKPKVEADSKRGARRSDTFYAVLAAEYVEAMARDPQRPVLVLAKRRGLQASRVRDMLHTARKRGLLTSGTQGRSGGGLTARTIELLGERTANPKPDAKRRRVKDGKGR
ncbi:MAG: hypothetical protein ABIR79_07305 [Candidatus Binatia bacterium]